MIEYIKTAWDRITGTRIGQIALVGLTLVALSLVAIQPSTFGTMPATDDGLLHLYRLIGLDHAVRDGHLWPRYVPGMAYGYGVPVFNYYSPLSLYPAEVFQLTGLNFVSALLLSMIGMTLAGAAGMYLLARDWMNRTAGIAAAVAFIYAPYLIINWPRRGAVAEYAALCLMPWAMWAFHRLGKRGRPIDFALAAGAFAAVIVTHNISALVIVFLLVPYALLLWWTAPDPQRAFGRLLLAGVLALAASAFYWIPALLELDYVHIERVTGATGTLDYTDHFIRLRTIFGLPPTADLTQLNSPVPRSLAWPQAVLATVAGVLALRTRSDRRVPYHLAMYALPLTLAAIAMMMPLSRFIWDTVPLLEYFQFPWRWLGPASLLIALMAGIGVAWVAELIPQQGLKITWVALMLAAMTLYAAPWLYGQYLPDVAADTILDAQTFERDTRRIGGTAEGEYVPRWSDQMPDPDALIGLFAQDDVIDRLQPNRAITAENIHWRTLGVTLTVTAQQDTALTFNWLYFPGWWAEIDGERTDITPTSPEGLIALEVPAGTHRIELGFGPTPLRRTAGIISLLALVGGIALMAAPVKLWRPATVPELMGEPQPGAATDSWPLVASMLGIGLALFGIKALALDNIDSPLKRARFANGLEDGLQYPVLATMGDQIRLLGFDLPDPVVDAPGPVDVVLYWDLAGDLIGQDHSSVVIIQDANGSILGQTLTFTPARVPTSTWVPGFYVREQVTVSLPLGTPPGVYTLSTTMYDHSIGRNMDVKNAAGNPVGVYAELGPVILDRPAQPVTLADLDLPDPLNVEMVPRLTLVDAAGTPQEAGVGSAFVAEWYWYAVAEPLHDYSARLLWLDQNGEVAASSAVKPLTAGFETTRWAAGELWRGVHLLYVPGRLEAGTYTVVVDLLDETRTSVAEPVPFAEMRITEPERDFSAPTPARRDGTRWNTGITLTGYDLIRPRITAGDGVQITLYWTTDTDLRDNLSIFVHIINEAGEIVAQQDRIPAIGERPTTGWAPGETITDRYAIPVPGDLPAGSYQIRVGWYAPLDGSRVLTDGGAEFVVLGQAVAVGD